MKNSTNMLNWIKINYLLIIVFFFSCQKNIDCPYNENSQFIIGNGMTEYNSKNLIFSMDYLDIKEIKVTLTNEEKKRIIDLLCKYKFEDLHLNKTIKGETAIVTSSPFLIYKIVVNKKKLEMDDHILININDKYNDKFIDLWSEIWSIITHKKELENKLPSF